MSEWLATALYCALALGLMWGLVAFARWHDRRMTDEQRKWTEREEWRHGRW